MKTNQILKALISSLIFTSLIATVAGCTGMDEKAMMGDLKMNPKSGFQDIQLKDAETGNFFKITDGKYRLDFEQGIWLWSDPKIKISDARGKVLGYLQIPEDSLKEDGAFELYTSNGTSKYSYNILGGKRTIVHSVKREVKLDQSCSYTETYSCLDGDGKPSTCSKTVSGDQDELWETKTFHNVYRILFESYDIENAGVFTVSGKLQTSSKSVDNDGCD